MIAIVVGVAAPTRVPSGVKEHGLSLQLQTLKHAFGDAALWRINLPDHQAIEICERIQIKAGEVFAVSVAVKRAVKIGSGIGNHFNLAHMKLSARLIDFLGSLARKVVGNYRRRQTLVSDHAVLNRVANVNYFVIFHCDTVRFGNRYSSSAPIPDN